MSQKENSFIWYFNSYSGDHFFAGSCRRATIGRSSDGKQKGLIRYLPQGCC